MSLKKNKKKQKKTKKKRRDELPTFFQEPTKLALEEMNKLNMIFFSNWNISIYYLLQHVIIK